MRRRFNSNSIEYHKTNSPFPTRHHAFLFQSLAFLLAFDATTSIDVTTRRETGKFSKKNEALRVCTWRNFAGSSKYRNCQKRETEIEIGCGDEDADDTTRMCKVTEHPWNNEQKEEDTDASAAACVVHGSFDPNTHITTDSATGLCHLEFLSLLDSCDVNADGSPSGVFGMKAEIHNRRNTDNDDNSGMMLRFSRTEGAVYYNDDDPRETVPLHDIIQAERKLTEKCYETEGTFNGWCCDNKSCFSNIVGNGIYFEQCCDKNGCTKKENLDNYDAFETCFGFGAPDGEFRCWSKSHYKCWSPFSDLPHCWFPCVPRDGIVNGNYVHWYFAQPLDDGSCGDPCRSDDYGFNEANAYPLHKVGDSQLCNLAGGVR